MGTYYTAAPPTSMPGYLLQPESRILIGTGNLYNSLDNTTWTYQTYEASVGMRAGLFFDVGLVDSLSFTYQVTIEPLDSANVADASIYQVTGEETTLTVGIREWNPATLEVAVATGTLFDSTEMGDDRLLVFGGGCNIQARPISVEFTNDSCDAPTAQNFASSGITGGVLTLYDCICTSGIPWSSIVANEVSVLELEFEARPVLARTKGRRLGNIYLY